MVISFKILYEFKTTLNYTFLRKYNPQITTQAIKFYSGNWEQWSKKTERNNKVDHRTGTWIEMLASREKTIEQAFGIGTHSQDLKNARQTCAVLYGLETVAINVDQ